jgi:hypothetical protein
LPERTPVTITLFFFLFKNLKKKKECGTILMNERYLFALVFFWSLPRAVSPSYFIWSLAMAVVRLLKKNYLTLASVAVL